MPSVDYDTYLFQELQDLGEAAAYLTACFEDSEEIFLQGLRKVVEAHGGVGKLAKGTELNRESLYKMLSENGNPQLYSLAAILGNLGLQIQFKPAGDKSKVEVA